MSDVIIHYAPRGSRMNPPSVWVFTLFSLKKDIYMAVRNPAPKYQTSFVHVPARGLSAAEMTKSTRSNYQYKFELTPVLENIVHYHTGLHADGENRLLHFENSPLFSGHIQNRPVVAITLNLGTFDALPTIPKADLTNVPAGIVGDEALGTCDNVRKMVAWVKLADLMKGIRYTGGEINENVCSPEASPFTFFPQNKTGFPLAGGQTTKVQQSMLFLLQKIARHHRIHGSLIPNVTTEHLMRSRLHNRYPVDPKGYLIVRP